jgi:hypothetical protein
MDCFLYVLFFVVSLLEQRPSCRNDDQASADLHHEDSKICGQEDLWSSMIGNGQEETEIPLDPAE